MYKHEAEVVVVGVGGEGEGGLFTKLIRHQKMNAELNCEFGMADSEPFLDESSIPSLNC